MRFTIPGDNTVRPGSKRPVRCHEFQVDFPTPSDTATLDALVGNGEGGAWERVKARGTDSIVVYGYGPEILAGGKVSAHTFSHSEQIDLSSEVDVLDAVIAAVPGAFAAAAEKARDEYEARIARITADQSGANDFIAALADREG